MVISLAILGIVHMARDTCDNTQTSFNRVRDKYSRHLLHSRMSMNLDTESGVFYGGASSICSMVHGARFTTDHQDMVQVPGRVYQDRTMECKVQE